MKNFLFGLLCMLTFVVSSQQENNQNEEESIFRKFLNNLNGSVESNMQWYNDDEKLGDFTEDNRFRSNSYAKFDYEFLKNFSAGVQIESYEPLHLLNYYPEYEGTNFATYYARYKNEKLDITAGYFYEQFGSGLLLRAFEERQLGLNNALRGGRIKYNPTNYLNLTALYGQNRIAFKVANSSIFGFDTNLNLAQAFNLKKVTDFSLGFSYVGKQEDFKTDNISFNTDNFPEIVHSFAVRTDLDFGNFYTNLEISLKGEDITYTPASQGPQQINERNYFKGNALLFTTGYTKKGFGLSGTFRRLENMSFFAERDFARSGENQFQMLSINYIPALTKQQDYSLANIYLYQPQPNLVIDNFLGQAGEIGGQLDLFYNIKKGSVLGGKYGTKITANLSYWSLLDANFNQKNSVYSTSFLKFGKRLNRDFSLEVRKKWSRKLSSIFTYIDQIIDKGVSLGGPLGVQGNVNSKIAVAETTIKLKNKKSIRLEGQHLWTQQDRKNWVGGTVEFNINRNFSIYAADIYNYGNDVENDKIHYYNFGGSFTKGATRIALNYGRQRGGLLCVGGVCRFVSPNTGLTVNVNTSF